MDKEMTVSKTNPSDLQIISFSLYKEWEDWLEQNHADFKGIWPALKYIIKWTGKVDDFLVDFSMKLARDGAWKFANRFVGVPDHEISLSIEERDQKVANKVNIILKPGRIATITLGIIRLTESGSVSEKIRKLKKADL